MLIVHGQALNGVLSWQLDGSSLRAEVTWGPYKRPEISRPYSEGPHVTPFITCSAQDPPCTNFLPVGHLILIFSYSHYRFDFFVFELIVVSPKLKLAFQ